MRSSRDPAAFRLILAFVLVALVINVALAVVGLQILEVLGLWPPEPEGAAVRVADPATA